jgi:hypothetical protein
MVATLRTAAVLVCNLVAVTREDAVDLVCGVGVAVCELAAALVVELVFAVGFDTGRFAVAAELTGWTGAA